MAITTESMFGTGGAGAPSATSSVAAGMAAGASFGPVGIFVGAAVGMFAHRKARKAWRRKQIEYTKASYSYAEQAFSYLGQGREQVGETYQRELASGRARFGASGASLEGSAWESVQGEALRKRDEALEGLGLEEEQFRATESYKLFGQDYERMLGGVTSRKREGGAEEGETVTRYGVGRTGITGESIFTPEQQKKLQTYKHKGVADKSGGLTSFKEYSSMITPSLEEWEKARFGSDEDRTAFSSMLDERIEKANVWYDQKKKETTITEANTTSFYRSGGRR